ncbi:MAG TPA: YraN family protein [Prolixibacteraceae bacterium]|nr:YraN family protein [Prolixibacteraceae bacterium]
MSKASELGRKGEELAVEHLRSIGYKILAINWFSHHLEIDIIAMDGNELVIVEVKARGSDSYEHPSEAVSNKKIRFLVNAAEAYIMENDINIDTRFDVISLVFSGKNFELEHFVNAFYPPVG